MHQRCPKGLVRIARNRRDEINGSAHLIVQHRPNVTRVDDRIVLGDLKGDAQVAISKMVFHQIGGQFTKAKEDD